MKMFKRSSLSVAALLFILAVAIGQAGNRTKICLVHAVDTDEARFGPFPWPRSVHAELVGKLEAAGADWIALKYLFAEPRPSDEQLIDVCGQYGNIVIPFACSLAAPEETLDTSLMREYAFKDETKDTRFLSYSSCAGPYSDLGRRAGGIGSIDIHTTAEREIVRMPLVVRVGDTLYPSYPLMVAMRAAGVSCKDVVVRDGSVLLGKGKQLPMDSEGMFRPQFTVPGKGYKSYTYTDILEGRFESRDLKDSIVIIGYNGTKQVVDFVTPVSREHNGTDMNADAVRTLLREILR